MSSQFAMWLAASVHGVRLGRDLVLLDLGQDEYFCVPDQARARIDVQTGRVAGLSRAAANLLISAGLIDPKTAPKPRPAPPPLPTRDLRHASPNRARIGEGLSALASVRRLRRLGPDPRVQDLLDLNSFYETRSAATNVLERSATFARVLPWLPFEGECLRRSALMAVWLREEGVSCSWVFGVRTWPFRAHCWLQHEDVCLNDDHEAVRAYAPLLVR